MTEQNRRLVLAERPKGMVDDGNRPHRATGRPGRGGG